MRHCVLFFLIKHVCVNHKNVGCFSGYFRSYLTKTCINTDNAVRIMYKIEEISLLNFWNFADKKRKQNSMLKTGKYVSDSVIGNVVYACTILISVS